MIKQVSGEISGDCSVVLTAMSICSQATAELNTNYYKNPQCIPALFEAAAQSENQGVSFDTRTARSGRPNMRSIKTGPSTGCQRIAETSLAQGWKDVGNCPPGVQGKD